MKSSKLAYARFLLNSLTARNLGRATDGMQFSDVIVLDIMSRLVGNSDFM